MALRRLLLPHVAAIVAVAEVVKRLEIMPLVEHDDFAPDEDSVILEIIWLSSSTRSLNPRERISVGWLLGRHHASTVANLATK